MGHTSIIDLTFKNMAANGANILREFQVDTNIGTLSDHHTIVFQLGNPDTIVLNPMTNKLNWKHADKEEFTDTLRNVLTEDKQSYDLIVSNILHYEKQMATPAELDGATEYIQNLLQKTVDHTIPTHRVCSKSKPWWTLELSKVYRELCEA